MPDEVVEAGGWVMRQTSGTALITKLMRGLAWGLLLAGPIFGAVALLKPSPSVGVPQARATSAAPARDTAGPAGFAEMYVSAYVAAGRGEEAQLQPFFPGARDVSLDADPNLQRAERLAAVRVKEVRGGYWSVTVAARVTESGAKGKDAKADAAGEQADAVEALRYFQVPVASVAGGGFAAVALPAEVSSPGGGAPDESELAYGPAVPGARGDAAVSAVREFLTAYLTGAGGLDRYLSPRTRMQAVSPPPYEEVAVRQLAEAGGDFQTGVAAKDGARRELLVDVDATDSLGRSRPLTYALTLQGRDGRWEVAALDAAPALNRASGEGTKGTNQ
ncbi:conjugal transfer protein [Streptomyces sp. LHD-70]|uniref:conjugal transfer protein n=1 Tax=Streptomyces sp. LHD-70 TaxID=3072140 RepID=UPI00280E8793|nr:conjugal transfer protein [Streptomyces sp. LHD-70]MDQ8707489.1 conjugal transfer protein [Streptomyces sp. LHD-70]